MRFKFLYLILTLCTSCSLLEQHQQRQAVKYAERHGGIIQTDTARDTVFTIRPVAQTDTIYKTRPGKTDTFNLVLDNRVFTTIYKNDSSLGVRQYIKADTTAAVNTTIENQWFAAAKSNGFFIRFVVVAFLLMMSFIALAKLIQALKS